MDIMDKILTLQEEMNRKLRSEKNRLEDALKTYKSRSKTINRRDYDIYLDQFERFQSDMDAYTDYVNAKMVKVNQHWEDNRALQQEFRTLYMECIKTANESRLESLESLVRDSLAGVDPTTLPPAARAVLTHSYGGGKHRNTRNRRARRARRTRR
jgi:DNA repair exonuclease SbcCD ATPase subunit